MPIYELTYRWPFGPISLWPRKNRSRGVLILTEDEAKAISESLHTFERKAEEQYNIHVKPIVDQAHEFVKGLESKRWRKEE